MKKIGVFGGSFNPVHKGHIALARQILRQAALDEVWFMVTPQNPFKQEATDLLDDEKRLRMVEKALANDPLLKASDFEFRLPRPSYTWQTLQALSKDFPDHRFTLLIGADNWTAFSRWYHAYDILSTYPIVIYPREGHEVDEQSLPPSVSLIHTRLYRISSTAIREKVKAGKGIARWIPKEITEEVKAYYR